MMQKKGRAAGERTFVYFVIPRGSDGAECYASNRGRNNDCEGEELHRASVVSRDYMTKKVDSVLCECENEVINSDLERMNR